MQTRKLSLLESTVNMIVAFICSVLISYTILPVWGFVPTIIDSVEITILFTTISFIRTYILRRLFNSFS